jgi:SAM-dependent methyltransferase
MRRHDTPAPIAERIAGWIPGDAKRILDPAVGTGALLKPIMDAGRTFDLVGVDVDGEALRAFRSSTAGERGVRATLINGNFLTVFSDAPLSSSALFDCAVMNPPFDARHSVTIAIEQDRRVATIKVPVEAAFVARAAQLIRPGGRLLAIVPNSFVAGSASAPVREWLERHGTIDWVHELPAFSFPGLEVQPYLMMFERRELRAPIKLLNHRLTDPDELVLPRGSLTADRRLDYGFYAARSVLSKLQERSHGWKRLGDIANVSRGTLPRASRRDLLHTTAYRQGVWLNNAPPRDTSAPEVIAREGDLLLSRVGRRAISSLGMFIGAPATISDCVVRIRPDTGLPTTRLLFALRALWGTEGFSRLLEKGCGAKYVTVADVTECPVPLDLHLIAPKAFHRYVRALRSQDVELMEGIEAEVRATHLG